MSRLRLSRLSFLIPGLLTSLHLACSVDSAKNHYLLAEKLWTDRKYSAAVSEFERVITKDPSGKLGRQALYRAASTQAMFLYEYNDAIRKFREYVRSHPDDPSSWQAQLQIGEILFSKVDQYDQAILHYRSLLKQRPDALEAPEFLFRIGKSQFYLLQFDEAVSTYQEIEKKFPLTPWAEKAAFEMGVTHFTQGEKTSQEKGKSSNGYDVALQAYQRFIQQYPKSQLIPSAEFGKASCFEELNQLENAYQAFSKLKTTYPSRNVIQIKLTRIQERMAQKNITRLKQ